MQFKQFYGSIVITKPGAKVITIESSQDAFNYVLRWFVIARALLLFTRKGIKRGL
jgi:hypothetical protein